MTGEELSMKEEEEELSMKMANYTVTASARRAESGRRAFQTTGKS